LLKRELDVLARLGARLNEQQLLFRGPPLAFFSADFPALAVNRRRRGATIRIYQVDLVSDKDARKVWVCVSPHVGEPRPCVCET
jgi:hypothetical protein